jgi:Mg/Co/Ni transporter MgtE
MENAYLSAEEIYAIDELSEASLADYLLSLPGEKKELVSHIFSKNRSLKLLKVVADESGESNIRLVNLLEQHGIQHQRVLA